MVMERFKRWYEENKESLMLRTMRGLLKNKKGMIGLTVLLLIVLMALTAPYISPYDPNEIHPEDRYHPPSFKYWFGTDDFGRDILSRCIYGSRISLWVGIVSVSIAMVTGIIIGLISGYAGGIVDEIIMRVMDAMMSFPTIFLALLILAVMGIGITSLMVAIGFVYMPRFARLQRAAVLSVKEQTYIEAARACGDPDYRILFREIFPNALAPMVVQATMSFGVAILYEAFFSFIGLGIPPPTPAWGAMLRRAQAYLVNSPWMSIFPGIAIMISVLSINLFGDALRDVLDPRLRIE